MPDIITVTVDDLPPISAVTGTEQVAVYKDGKLGKIPQAALRGTRTFSDLTDPPSLPSVIAALMPMLNDRWRNTATGDEWKVTSLQPFVWMPDGNVKGADGSSNEPGPPGPPGEKGAKGDDGKSVQRFASVAIPASTYVVDQPGGACVIADPRIPSHAGKVLGLVAQATPANSVSTIQRDGPIANVSGAFNPSDALYIGDGTTGRLGSIVNRPPIPRTDIDVWRQQVGTATTSNLINGALGLAYKVPALGSTAIVGASGGFAVISDLGRGFVEATAASVVASLLLVLDDLPALPLDPADYPAGGGLFRVGDANGWTLTRILPKV